MSVSSEIFSQPKPERPYKSKIRLREHTETRETFGESIVNDGRVIARTVVSGIRQIIWHARERLTADEEATGTVHHLEEARMRLHGAGSLIAAQVAETVCISEREAELAGYEALLGVPVSEDQAHYIEMVAEYGRRMKGL